MPKYAMEIQKIQEGLMLSGKLAAISRCIAPCGVYESSFTRYLQDWVPIWKVADILQQPWCSREALNYAHPVIRIWDADAFLDILVGEGALSPEQAALILLRAALKMAEDAPP